MIIIDTNVYAFGFNLMNGIPILPFIKDTNDEELQMLLPIIKAAEKEYDVRQYLKEKLKLLDIAEEAFEFKSTK